LTQSESKDFNAKSERKKISIADLIVLGGNTAIEEAAKKAVHLYSRRL